MLMVMEITDNVKFAMKITNFMNSDISLVFTRYLLSEIFFIFFIIIYKYNKLKKMSDDEEKKDDDGFSVTSQQSVKLLDHDEDRNKNLYKSFIVIIFSSFCLTISLGVNEMFKLILDHTKSDKSNVNEIGYYVVYIFALVIITLGLVYFLNVEVS